MTFASTSGLEATVYIDPDDMGTVGVCFDLPITIPDQAFGEMMTLYFAASRAAGVGQDVNDWLGDLFGTMAIGTDDLYHQQFTNVLVQVLYSDGILGAFIANLNMMVAPTLAVTPTVRPTPAPRTSFGDGTWLVGVDIAPGTYRTTVPGNGCMWQRLSGLSGTYEDIIAWGAPNSGQALVAIAPSDLAFSTDACGQWSLLP